MSVFNNKEKVKKKEYETQNTRSKIMYEPSLKKSGVVWKKYGNLGKYIFLTQ